MSNTHYTAVIDIKKVHEAHYEKVQYKDDKYIPEKVDDVTHLVLRAKTIDGLIDTIQDTLGVINHDI